MTKQVVSKVQIEKVLDCAGVGMMLVDLEGFVIYTNASFSDLLGYSSTEINGRSALDMVHPDDREALSLRQGEISSRALTGYNDERRYLHKDGKYIPVLATVSTYSGSEDGPEFVVVQLTDISTQKQAEQALAISEDRWNFALESARQGVWDNNLARGEVFYSQMWREMRGLAPDEDIGSIGEQQERIHPDDRQFYLEAVKRLDWGFFGDDGFEYREWHRDGYWMWILARGRAIEWGPDHRPTRVIGTDTDITQLKNSERSMEALSRRLELAMTTSGVGVWELDLETGATNCDERILEMYDFPLKNGSEVSLQAWKEVLHPDDAARAVRNVEQAIETMSEFEYKYRIVRPDGEIRHILTSGRYYLDAGHAPKLLGVDRDITDDVQSASELSQAKELAEQRNVALEAARASMEHNALHDALTGLPNRRYLDETLAEFSKMNSGGALLHIDLDRFKQINDTLGHAAGDAMLVHAAKVLRNNVAQKDFVARVGGDEFVVFVGEDKSSDDLAAMARRIVAIMSEPVTYMTHECRFGVSVGVVSEKGPLIDTKQMLVNADIALYRAKANGRNRVEFFTDALQSEIVTTKHRADEILVGLEQSQFFAHYQPQFDVHSFDIVGVEALARWRHPNEGVLLPDAFLKIAEDLAVVANVDKLVLEQSAAHLKRWRERGISIPKVSVNVSSRRLRDEALVASLAELDYLPGTISFELLESIFLDESDEIVNWNIDQIKEMGIGIDIDDFGTGHASIVGLLNLSPQRLKIDRQLIDPIARSKQQRNLVKSIIEIGKSLGIHVVAEGVETMEQVMILQDLGCDTIQGYVFAHPMDVMNLEKFVKAQAWREAS